MLKKLNNIGDSAVVCDFGDEVNQPVNNEVIKLFHFIKKQSALGNIKGILNCSPSYNKLIISFALHTTNLKNVFDFINSVDFTNLNLEQEKKNGLFQFVMILVWI